MWEESDSHFHVRRYRFWTIAILLVAVAVSVAVVSLALNDFSRTIQLQWRNSRIAYLRTVRNELRDAPSLSGLSDQVDETRLFRRIGG